MKDKILRIDEVFRVPSQKSGGVILDKVDGLRNHYHVTSRPDEYVVGEGDPTIGLGAGINTPAEVRGSDGLIRRPAIIIRSSPHKSGSHQTPWRDNFDIDNGHIHYFGDTKTAGETPELTRGNKELLALFDQHHSDDPVVREKAAPLIFYLSPKTGYAIFKGYGVIRSASRVVQRHSQTGETFTNYVFDFTVLGLEQEGDGFDWNWILDRRDPSISVKETLKNAPLSWKTWIKEGHSSLDKLKRKVSKFLVTSKSDQVVSPGSDSEILLKAIYHYYPTNQKKKRFEGLAAFVASKVLNETGEYEAGWISPGSGDKGIDFYGVLTVGKGFGKARMIVLGQAKCEKLNSPTNGTHVARTVARLKRGWLGVYVTTSYFSNHVQEEIIEDSYPLVLINGKKIAEVVAKELFDRRLTIDEFLDWVDAEYEGQLASRRPEELLLS